MKRRTLIWRNLRRHQTHSIFASFGIIVGVALLLYFGALSAGVEKHVVSRIIPDRQVEVVPRSVQLGAFQRQGGLFGGSGSGLTDFTVADLQALPGVVNVYPRQQIGFPALARGGAALLGENMYAELLADGVPAALVEERFQRAQAGALAFVDWEAITRCDAGETCAAGSECVQGACVARACTPEDEIWWARSRAELTQAQSLARSLTPSGARFVTREFTSTSGERLFSLAIADAAQAQMLRDELDYREVPGALPSGKDACGEGPAYCHVATRSCQMPVPVLASPTMLELYNGNLQSMMSGAATGTRPPRLTEAAIVGMAFEATLGRGMLGTSRGVREGRETPEDLRLHVVGFSPVALPLGATIPIGYVTRWNARYGDQDNAGSWSSILVEVERPKDLNPVVDAIEGELGLAVHDRFEAARRAAGLVSIVTLVMAGIGGVMVFVASVNIAHTFMMLVTERRREIGIMRSLGATRTDVTTLLLGEAAFIGVFGWLLALGLARAVAWGTDLVLRRWVPEFPWKPETLFDFGPALLAISFAVALLCATLGAWFPSSKAAKMDPADALREHD